MKESKQFKVAIEKDYVGTIVADNFTFNHDGVVFFTQTLGGMPVNVAFVSNAQGIKSITSEPYVPPENQ
jgi:hypothetical protein